MNHSYSGAEPRRSTRTRPSRTRPSIKYEYSIMSSNEGNRMIQEIQRQQIRDRLRKEQNAIGSNMIRDIQEQKRREESAEANRMIREIQSQQRRARQLMYKAETRKRVKPAPSRRQRNRAQVRNKIKEIMTRKSKTNSKTKKKYTL